MGETIIDRDHLAAMTGGDGELAIEVLGIFKEQAMMWSRLLDPREDAARWADAAHTLKGSALSIGAMRMADVCARAETLGRGSAPSVAAAAVMLDEVRAAMIEAIEACARLVHELEVSGTFRASNTENS